MLSSWKGDQFNFHWRKQEGAMSCDFRFLREILEEFQSTLSSSKPIREIKGMFEYLALLYTLLTKDG